MQTTWVLAADSSRARIFELSASDGHLQEVEDMLNPEGRMAEQDINAEPKSRFFGTGPMGSTGQKAEEPKQHAAELFSKQVAHWLDDARNEHKFDKLCVVAPPHMLGLLRENLSKEVQKMVEEEIPKDIAGMKEHEMEEYLRKYPH
ncbi:host attachment protein [Massilia terrae]|uniref:Host attachment protein n=1 Tax=Massilia terrae TaxID=1811224 RepID=A0ABT2CZ43_9BURK|nr:host attachment protein [Massilia terrae]MCS0659244.1 host attachment protein [Massilia terrae]